MKNKKSFSASCAFRFCGALVLLYAHPSWALPTASYVPLAPGNSWTYAVVDSGISSTEVETVSPNMVLFNGANTYEIASSTGDKSYELNDQNGYREFGSYTPSVFINGYGNTSVTTTFSPPVLDAPANFSVGQTQSGSTTLSMIFQGVATISGPATYSTQAVGYEYVTVPAGTFYALRVSYTQSFNGTVSNTGASVSLNCTSALWLVENIGKVKSTETCTDGTDTTRSLISYSIGANPIVDTVAPSIPSGVAASSVGATQVNLTWAVSTDNVGVTRYTVYRNGVQAGTPTATGFMDTGLTAATAYRYTVAACDAAGNCSAQSSAVSVTTAVPDTIAPTVPTGLTGSAASTTQINLTWTAQTDNVGVTGYKVYRNGVQVGTPAGTSFGDTGLSPGIPYSYTVAACDAAGNCSVQSAAATATTMAKVYEETDVIDAPTNATVLIY